MSDKIIYSLDIGNSKIKVMVGSIDNLQVIGMGGFNYQDYNSPNFIQNGIITNMELAQQQVKNCLLEAQIQSDCTAGGVILNCAGINLSYYNDSIEYKLHGKPVTAEHITHLTQQAKKSVQQYQEFQISQFNVQQYVIDNLYVAKNPLSIICNSIKMNYNIILAKNMLINNLNQLIPREFTIEKIVPTATLSALAAVSYDQLAQGVCCIDIGHATTNLAIYKNHILQFHLSIPFGGFNVTATIANRFKLSLDGAEDIKITKGFCRHYKDKFDHENIQVLDYNGFSKDISNHILTEIISNKLQELFNYINQQIISLNLDGLLLRGYVLTGGVANTIGICDLATDILQNSVITSKLNYGGDYQELVNQNINATSLGGLIYAKKMMEQNLDTKQTPSFWQKIRYYFQ